MGNLVLALQRAAAGTALDPSVFSGLLVDLYLTRRTIGAHLEGCIELDPRFAEDLTGKTWRDEDLDPVSGLDLIEVAAESTADGEFRIETSHLADIHTGQLYGEKQITPLRLRTSPKPRHRHRLAVEDAGLYPGAPPRRIKLRRTQQHPLSAEDAERLVGCVPDSVPGLQQMLVERLDTPFQPADLPVLFRPAALVRQGETPAALDQDRHLLRLDWPASWFNELPAILPPTGRFALCGLLTLDREGVRLRCLSVLGPLRWGRGPVYPDAPPGRRK
jgi:hypothetical protein